ncbi:hypothetical protein FRC02_009112 [Tulasnella sp. 418]|nr:hypothetical protein FRC02_009112 [Tulasnella sp. 418]
MEDVTTVHSSEQEEIELAVDEKQEEIDHCQNDQELLLWSIGFFQRQSELLKGKGQSSNDPSTPSASAADESSQDELAKERALYPHIIPRLMKTFRDRYHDPNLALAIFDFTRNFSIQSFLLGCSTSAYNELLKILWKDFRNLKRIAESLDDMDVNGIVPDADTIRLVEGIIADLSSRGDLSNAAEIGRILKRMESMSAQSYEDRRQKLDRRKGFVLDDWDDDESSFAFQ